MNDDAYTIFSGLVPLWNNHSLYMQLWGNKTSKHPIISTHGGPGDAVKDSYKKYFDPKKHLVLFFDQRGCGASTPAGLIEHNTLQDTLKDIDFLANKFNFNTFSFAGGSWSSTVALAYAIYNPQAVSHLYINGIFTASKKEIDHLEKGMFKQYFPDVWDTYLSNTPKIHHADPSEYHLKNILGKDSIKAQKSAYVHSNLEGAIVALESEQSTEQMDPEFSYESSKVYAHYILNDCFLEDEYILKNAHKITAKTYIVQGRYDMICPPITAYNVHKAIKNSSLVYTVGGHSSRNTKDVMKALLATHI
jgi:proline iminopeptidase